MKPKTLIIVLLSVILVYFLFIKQYKLAPIDPNNVLSAPNAKIPQDRYVNGLTAILNGGELKYE